MEMLLLVLSFANSRIMELSLQVLANAQTLYQTKTVMLSSLVLAIVIHPME